MKTRGSKTSKLKRGREATAARGGGSSVSYLKEQLDWHTRELNEAQTKLDLRSRELGEALEQQAATAEILRVISSSPTDLQRVFAVVAKSATRLCDASDATIHQVDGAVLRLVAHHGPNSRPWLVANDARRSRWTCRPRPANDPRRRFAGRNW